MGKPLLIDLFAGRLGWSKGFLARGWKVRAYDLIWRYLKGWNTSCKTF